ncbi:MULTISPECIES: hypothetical protein [Cysteiniphilum]|nr:MULTISPECIES: hypothetical protein [Cysteiniphilum]
MKYIMVLCASFGLSNLTYAACSAHNTAPQQVETQAKVDAE